MSDPAFQWLRDELRAIRAQRFHVFEKSDLPLESGRWDPAITSFICEFGSARLYRSGVGHRISLHHPRPPESGAIRAIVGDRLEVGTAHDDAIFVGPVDVDGSCLWKLDVHASKVRAIRHPFVEWLKRAGKSARRLYTLEEWDDMALDPKPFTALELERLTARKSFVWTVERLARRPAEPTWVQNFAVEVTNRSDRTLPYLTIGVRWRSAWTRVFLDVSRIGPGEQRRITRSIDGPEPRVFPEFHPVEDPLPEERDIFWELRGASLESLAPGSDQP